MRTTGTGIFFDGVTSTRHEVAVELTPGALQVVGSDGKVLADWPYAELDHVAAPDHVLRLGRAGSQTLARLDIHDHDLAHAIDERSVAVDRTDATVTRQRRVVVAWSFAAVASLFFLGVYGVPELASRAAPYVPHRVERYIGDAVDAQIRSTLDTKGLGAQFECGLAESEQAGKRVFDRLMNKMANAAALPIPLRPVVVRREDANATALPGGRIYVYQGLIAKSESADELAAVIGHEIGHIAHRDGTRSILQAAGLSFLFGMMLGDFVGGGAVVIAARTILKNSYTREQEAAADAYGVDLMKMVGGNPHALATLLARITGSSKDLKILLDHPEIKDRVTAIHARAEATPEGRLLDMRDWAALKNICAAR